jgi:hypothetical protein
MKRRTAGKIAGLFVLFAVSLLALSKLIPLIPGFNALPPILMFGLPLGLAWLIAAGIGSGFIGGKRAATLATVCLVIAAPLVWKEEQSVEQPEEPAPVWSPPIASPPENIPENMVAFRFVSAFTYLGEEEDPPLLGLDLDLPWPHVGGWSIGIPEEDLIPGHQILGPFGDPENENTWTYVDYFWERPEVRGTSPDELGSNRYSELLWVRIAIEKDNEILLEKRLENGELVTTKNTLYLRFGGVGEPYQDENIMAKAYLTMLDEEFRPKGSLLPGETVVLEGMFLAPEENENHVRIGDLATEGAFYDQLENDWVRPLKPEENGAPLVSTGWEGPIITLEWFITLEKWTESRFEIVAKFVERAENIDGSPGYGFPDQVI